MYLLQIARSNTQVNIGTSRKSKTRLSGLADVFIRTILRCTIQETAYTVSIISVQCYINYEIYYLLAPEITI